MSRAVIQTLCLVAILAPIAASQDAGAQLTHRDLGLKRIGSTTELTTPVQVPRGYAIVIGISDYKNLKASDRLPFAEKDAQNIYSALISKEAGNIEFENIVKLLGRDATLENLRNAIENWLPAKAGPADRVIVFFVGHGFVDAAGRGYLAPYDIEPADMSRTAYPMDRLGEVLSKEVKARWKLLLTDACHSGKITVNTTYEKINENLRGLPQGFLTLSSSRASQASYEDAELAGGNGVFSYFLARGWLGEADEEPADGKVTADELVAYVQREVRQYAKAKGRQQNPQESGEFPDEMLLGYNLERRKQLTSLLKEANGVVVIEVNLPDVEVTIDDRRAGVAHPKSPLRVPGLSAGPHTIRGSRAGYDPVTVEINVAPGGVQTVSLRIVNQRSVKSSAQALYNEGEAIWRRSNANASDLARSAELFSRAVKEDGSFSKALLDLCRVQQAQGNTDSALRTCAKAVSVDSDFPEARMHYGSLLMDRGDYAEAVRQLQRSAEQDSSNVFTHILLAEALFWADRPAESVAEANRALALDNSSGQAYFLRAEARRVQRDFAGARADYDRAIRLQSYDSGVLRVTAYWAIGHGMRKHRSGRRFLYRNQLSASLYGLCACDIGQQEYEDAIRNCKRSLSVDKSDPDPNALALLVEAYTGLFNQENRREYLVRTKDAIQTCLRINPNQEIAAALKLKLNEVNELLTVVK